MKSAELTSHLMEHWKELQKAVLDGSCRPEAVRRAEIPKPQGGVRKLGIPTVMDRMSCGPKVYFPTIFSPDGDGLNDSFGPAGAGFVALKLTVFDRWGNIWFEQGGPSPAWSPERCNPAVFTYLFEYKDLFSEEKRRVTGSVTVVK